MSHILSCQYPQQAPTYTINADLPTNRIEQYINDHIIKDLAIIDGVHSVELSGAAPDYTEISVNTGKIKSAGISTSDVYNSVTRYLGGSTVIGSAPMKDRTDEPDMVVRNAPMDLELLPVANTGGRIIRLMDVAAVKTRQALPSSYNRINGLNTINVIIYPEESVNTIKLCSEITGTMKRLEAGFPETFSALKSYDVSVDIQKEVSKLVRRSLLCVIILLVFIFLTSLSPRYTMLIAVTLAVNIIVAVILYVLLDIDIHIHITEHHHRQLDYHGLTLFLLQGQKSLSGHSGGTSDHHRLTGRDILPA